jgi:hypothetical protein
VDGAVTSGPDLSVEVNGLKLPNPFVIASGAPRPSWFFAALPVTCTAFNREIHYRGMTLDHCQVPAQGRNAPAVP